VSYTRMSRQGTDAGVLLHPTVLALSCCKLASMLQAVATGRRQTPPAAQVTSRTSVWFGDEPLHKRLLICLCWWAGMAQSVQQLATGWTVRGSDLGGGEIFHNGPDRPWGPPSLMNNGYRVPGLKTARGGVDHPLPSSAEVKEKVQLYFYSPSATSWPLLG
jgi:hypothetical protein